MRVYITRTIPSSGVKLLREKNVEVDIWESEEPIPHDVLVENIKNNYDGLYCMLTDTIDGEVLDAAGPRLKAICTMSVGYEHLDMIEINKRSIVAANCSTVSSDCVSEFAVTLVLALARRIIDAKETVRAGKWTPWDPMSLHGCEIKNKSIGIFGLGRIGLGIAQRLQAFKVLAIYYTDVKQKPYAQEVRAIYVTFDELLRNSDIICVCCNLTDQTRNVFNAAAFRRMKRTAVLVNISRGKVVNTNDLYQALKNKKIGMAALDVTDPDPLPKDHPLMSLDNCLVTPHVASATWESRNAMALMTAQNMLTILGGNDPLGRIRV